MRNPAPFIRKDDDRRYGDNACKPVGVSGEWTYLEIISAPISFTITTGTYWLTTSSETKSLERSTSTTVRQGWKFIGRSGSVSVTGVFAAETADTYEELWEDDTKKAVSVGPFDQMGYALWQWK